MPDQIPTSAQPVDTTTPQPEATQQPAPAVFEPSPALTPEQNEHAEQATRLLGEGTPLDEALATSEIVDRRPAAGWVEKPIAFRLVGKEQRAGHLTFVTEDTRDGVRKLERWWMPSSTAAAARIDGHVVRDLIKSGDDSALPLLMLEASSIDDDTLAALLALPAESFGRILGEWQSMQDQGGTTAGESSGSAAS